MGRMSLMIMLVVFLAACGKEQDPGKPIVEPTMPPASPTEATAERSGVDVLAGWGVKPNFPFFVAYDIMDRNRVGIPRHRVLLEVVGGTIDAATADMEMLLSGAGYSKERESVADGKLEQVFRKKGTPTLVLLHQSAATGPKLKQPEAVGSIHIMWNIK